MNDELRAALLEVIKEEAIDEWMNTRNTAFDCKTPLEVIECGESERLWSMIYFLRSGMPS